MKRLLIATALLWAGAASAQIKGGGYEIDPEPDRPEVESRSHFQGLYIGGTLGASRTVPNAAPPARPGVTLPLQRGSDRRNPASDRD